MKVSVRCVLAWEAARTHEMQTHLQALQPRPRMQSSIVATWRRQRGLRCTLRHEEMCFYPVPGPTTAAGGWVFFFVNVKWISKLPMRPRGHA